MDVTVGAPDKLGLFRPGRTCIEQLQGRRHCQWVLDRLPAGQKRDRSNHRAGFRHNLKYPDSIFRGLQMDTTTTGDEKLRRMFTLSKHPECQFCHGGSIGQQQGRFLHKIVIFTRQQPGQRIFRSFAFYFAETLKQPFASGETQRERQFFRIRWTFSAAVRGPGSGWLCDNPVRWRIDPFRL